MLARKAGVRGGRDSAEAREAVRDPSSRAMQPMLRIFRHLSLGKKPQT